VIVVAGIVVLALVLCVGLKRCRVGFLEDRPQ
jgi:hypothetical protein